MALSLPTAPLSGASSFHPEIVVRAVRPDVDGTTALQWAVRHNDGALVDRLLTAGADA